MTDDDAPKKKPARRPRAASKATPAGATKAPARRAKAGAAAPAPVAVTRSRREATRRLTLDVPESLHSAMKICAAVTGVPMIEEVTPVLMAHYAEYLKSYQL